MASSAVSNASKELQNVKESLSNKEKPKERKGRKQKGDSVTVSHDKPAPATEVAGSSQTPSPASASVNSDSSSSMEKILAAISNLEERQKEHEERVNTMFGLPPGHMAGVPGQEQNQSDDIDYDLYDEESGQVPGYYNEFADGDIEQSEIADKLLPKTKSTLSDMAKKYQKVEVCASDLDEGLAESINAIFREGLSEESLNSILKGISRPENCPALCTVKVNELIWKIISPHAQSRDRAFQNVQTHLVKGSTLLAQMLEHVNIMNEGEDRTKLLQMGLDSLALLGHTNRLLINRRRDVLRPEIQHDYGHLCSTSVPFTDKLFGDNVSQNVKDIQDIKRVEKVITKRWQGRYQPYQNYQPRGRGQGAYGGYSGGYQPRGQSFQQRGKFFPRGRGYPRSRNWPRGQATFTRSSQKKEKSE